MWAARREGSGSEEQRKIAKDWCTNISGREEAQMPSKKNRCLSLLYLEKDVETEAVMVRNLAICRINTANKRFPKFVFVLFDFLKNQQNPTNNHPISSSRKVFFVAVAEF